MKRWAVCRVGDYEGDGAIVPKFNVHNCNSRIWAKQGFGWCLGQIAAADLTAINADPDIFVLPDATLDMPLSTFSTAVRNNVRNKLSAAGFTISAIQNAWTIRQVFVYILQQLQPALGTVEQGDVADLKS